MCFTISTPRKGSLPFAASSMVKLIEGWLSFSVDAGFLQTLRGQLVEHNA